MEDGVQGIIPQIKQLQRSPDLYFLYINICIRNHKKLIISNDDDKKKRKKGVGVTGCYLVCGCGGRGVV
jgi:hypothetical protein